MGTPRESKKDVVNVVDLKKDVVAKLNYITALETADRTVKGIPYQYLITPVFKSWDSIFNNASLNNCFHLLAPVYEVFLKTYDSIMTFRKEALEAKISEPTVLKKAESAMDVCHSIMHDYLMKVGAYDKKMKPEAIKITESMALEMAKEFKDFSSDISNWRKDYNRIEEIIRSYKSNESTPLGLVDEIIRSVFIKHIKELNHEMNLYSYSLAKIHAFQAAMEEAKVFMNKSNFLLRKGINNDVDCALLCTMFLEEVYLQKIADRRSLKLINEIADTAWDKFCKQREKEDKIEQTIQDVLKVETNATQSDLAMAAVRAYANKVHRTDNIRLRQSYRQEYVFLNDLTLLLQVAVDKYKPSNYPKKWFYQNTDEYQVQKQIHIQKCNDAQRILSSIKNLAVDAVHKYVDTEGNIKEVTDMLKEELTALHREMLKAKLPNEARIILVALLKEANESCYRLENTKEASLIMLPPLNTPAPPTAPMPSSIGADDKGDSKRVDRNPNKGTDKKGDNNEVDRNSNRPTTS